jgi:ubiquinone/menaquinone biosynthesis C-methylase UbiE
MIAQRPAGSAPVVQASAEALPFDDDSFDAASFDDAGAIITVQHWADAAAGLAEMIRVSRERVLVLTFDGPAMAAMWMVRRGSKPYGRTSRAADERYGHLRTEPELDVGLRLVVAELDQYPRLDSNKRPTA